MLFRWKQISERAQNLRQGFWPQLARSTRARGEAGQPNLTANAHAGKYRRKEGEEEETDADSSTDVETDKRIGGVPIRESVLRGHQLRVFYLLTTRLGRWVGGLMGRGAMNVITSSDSADGLSIISLRLEQNTPVLCSQ